MAVLYGEYLHACITLLGAWAMLTYICWLGRHVHTIEHALEHDFAAAVPCSADRVYLSVLCESQANAN